MNIINHQVVLGLLINSGSNFQTDTNILKISPSPFLNALRVFIFFFFWGGHVYQIRHQYYSNFSGSLNAERSLNCTSSLEMC